MEATQAQQQASQRSLVRKLSEVMKAVERVPKRGRNAFHGYDYATEADIAAEVRKAMAERHLMLVPDVVETSWHDVPRKAGGVDRIATLKVKFTLMDGDSGEELAFHVLGEGQDGGDKATYKAMTGAIKYALLKLFLIPTGDDPEIDSSKPGTSADAKAASSERGSAPRSSDRTSTQKGTAQTKEPMVKLGRHKGKRLADVPTDDLPWLLDRAVEAEARKHDKWHADDLAWLKAVQAEQAKRAQASQQSAPAKGTAATNGTPFERLKAGMSSLGVPDKAYLDELKKRGKKCPADVTEDDYRALMAFFQGVGQEPPPPGDEDAPPEVGA